MTQSIVDYFNSKSWYQGTVDPDTFDAQQGSIFNEYEIANIQKIEEWGNAEKGSRKLIINHIMKQKGMYGKP